MRPNILVIFADQMRGDTMGCAGHPCVRTPHLDRLARDGVRFSRAFTPNPICVPARAAFTTGNYPHRCTGDKNNAGALREDQIRIAEWFARNGYGTYASGKLHYVPYAPPGQPRLVHGFQRVALHESGRVVGLYDPRGELTGLEDYHDYLREVGWGGYARAHGVGNNDIHPAPSPLPAEHYADAWVCSEAIRFLDDHRRHRSHEPFFMFMSFPKPHAPYDPPRPWDALYDPRRVPAPLQARDDEGALRTPTKGDEARSHGWGLWSPECHRVARAHYYGQVSFQDDQIGRMLAWLERQGLLDDTIVVYTADHGDLLGDFGFFGKSCFYQGSVGIPFIVHWPKALRRGLVSTAPVGLQDLLPTLAGLAGMSLPQAVDGIDLGPLLRGEEGPRREFFVAQCQRSPRQLCMVADRRWKYLYSERGGVEELYDHEHDPDDLTNLACRHASREVLEYFRKALRDWAEEHGDHEILAPGGGLAVSPMTDAGTVAFQPGSMGWRWY